MFPEGGNRTSGFHKELLLEIRQFLVLHRHGYAGSRQIRKDDIFSGGGHPFREYVHFVNMFISSDLQWKDKKVSLTMETAFPADDKVKLAIGSGGGKRFALAIRHPWWDRLPRLPLWPGPSWDKDRGSVPGAGGLPSTDKSADQQEG